MRHSDSRLHRPPAGRRLAALALAAALAGLFGRAAAGPEDGPPKGPAAEPGAVEVHFNDNSVLRLTLHEQKLELITPYGRLLIPAADIRRVEFATRITDDVAKRIEAAVANLGSASYKARESATAELLKLREKGYPALLQAAKHKDAEIVRRTEDLLEKLREQVPEELLQVRKHDVVYTADSRITGRLAGVSLKAHSAQLGELEPKLADIRSLRSLNAVEEQVVEAKPDPGNMTTYQNQMGKSFIFRVTGGVNGAVWGTDAYTTDSTLSAAAVHAGVLQPGQTGLVKVSIVAPPPVFQGSSRHGVTSAAFGPYPTAYRVSRMTRTDD
jgi:hypothetical protein